MTEEHWQWMRKAVDQGKASVAETRDTVPPRVGVVIVKDGELLGSAFRGKAAGGCHAEYSLLQELEQHDLTGADVYTTLEPCSRRNVPKRPCAERLAEAGVARVWIGMYDPNPRIYREGWRILRDAGIELRDFSPELRAEIVADNVDFLDSFRTGKVDNGSRTFNPTLNDGLFVIEAGGHRFETRWSKCGDTSAYVLHPSHGVALATFAQAFDEIDDPAALDWSSWQHELKEGSIAAFRDNERGFLLVRLEEVNDSSRASYSQEDVGPDGVVRNKPRNDRDELRISWEVRAATP